MAIRVFIKIFLAVAVLITISGGAYAAPPTVAIVDVEKIMADSKAAQSLQKQITAKKEAFQKEFAEKEKQLKATDTALMASRDKVTAEEFNKQRKAYEEQILETRKLFQKRRNSLDEGLSKAMQELRRNIIEAAASVADKKSYDIVLTRDSVLIAEKSLDITADVLSTLDANIASIQLTVE